MKGLMVSRFTIVAAVLWMNVIEAPVAVAKTDRRVQYTRQEVFRTFVRLLRVDLDFKILEKDLEGGYVLFEYRDSVFKRTSPASLEIIEIPGKEKPKDEEGGAVPRSKLVLNIKRCGASDEIALLNQLETKLQEEYGKR